MTVAVFKVWEVLTAVSRARVRVRVRAVVRVRGRVRGREQQPRRPRDHVQHPVTNGRARRHQRLHRPLNIGLNVLKKKIIMVCMECFCCYFLSLYHEISQFYS